MNKKAIIISSTTIFILIAGYMGLYYWGKYKFLQTQQEIVKTLENKGFKIHANTPITFSGFPFKIIAHQEKFTAIRTIGKIKSTISSSNTIVRMSIANPMQWDIKGNLKFEGHFAPPIIPLTRSKITKKYFTSNVGATINESKYPVNLGMTTPHLRFKLQIYQGKLMAKSVKMHDFKIKWEDPDVTHMQYLVIGQSAKYLLSPFTQTETNATYKLRFKFKDFEVQKIDLKAKQSSNVAIHKWSGELQLHGGNILQIFKKLGDIVITAVDQKSHSTLWCKFSGSLLNFATQRAYSLEKAETEKEHIALESTIVQGASEIKTNALLQLKQQRLILTLNLMTEEGGTAFLRLASFIAQLPPALTYRLDVKQEPNILPTEWKSSQGTMNFDLTDYFTDKDCQDT
jgi:hypothetical protein